MNPVTRIIALKYWLHNAFKIYYTPEEEMNFNSLDLFARVEAVDFINITKKYKILVRNNLLECLLVHQLEHSSI